MVIRDIHKHTDTHIDTQTRTQTNKGFMKQYKGYMNCPYILLSGCISVTVMTTHIFFKRYFKYIFAYILFVE